MKNFELAERYIGEALTEVKFSKIKEIKRFVYDTAGMCFLLES
jgi:hypothetical protein